MRCSGGLCQAEKGQSCCSIHSCFCSKPLFSLFSPPLGTEPWYFYFINGFLNFNVVFVLALLVLPLTCLMECLLQKFRGECRLCLPKSSFSLLGVKLGAVGAFGAPGEFLELLRVQDCSLPPPQEEKCVKESEPDKVPEFIVTFNPSGMAQSIILEGEEAEPGVVPTLSAAGNG